MAKTTTNKTATTTTFPRGKMDFTKRDKAFSALVDSYWCDYYEVAKQREALKAEKEQHETAFSNKVILVQMTADNTRILPSDYESCTTILEKWDYIVASGIVLTEEETDYLAAKVQMWKEADTKLRELKNPAIPDTFGLSGLYAQYSAIFEDNSGVAQEAYNDVLERYFSAHGMTLTQYGFNDLNRAIGSANHKDKDFMKNGLFLTKVSERVFKTRFVQFLSDGFTRVGLLEKSKAILASNCEDSSKDSAPAKTETTQESHDKSAEARAEILDKKSKESASKKPVNLNRLTKGELCEIVKNEAGNVAGLDKMKKADLVELIKTKGYEVA
jgi:hypothetical protein